MHSYSRYWHGYMVILKPLLLFLNLTEIRQLNLFVILAEFVIIAILMYRRRVIEYLAPFVLAIAFLNPITVSSSLQNSTSYHMMMAAVIVLLSFWEKSCFREHLYLFFLLCRHAYKLYGFSDLSGGYSVFSADSLLCAKRLSEGSGRGFGDFYSILCCGVLVMAECGRRNGYSQRCLPEKIIYRKGFLKYWCARAVILERG